MQSIILFAFSDQKSSVFLILILVKSQSTDYCACVLTELLDCAQMIEFGLEV